MRLVNSAQLSDEPGSADPRYKRIATTRPVYRSNRLQNKQINNAFYAKRGADTTADETTTGTAC